MKKEISIRLDTTEMISLERCLSDRNVEEAFRFLKALAAKVRYAQATSRTPYFEMSGARHGPESLKSQGEDTGPKSLPGRGARG